jgi:hypothetical protein
LDSLDAVFADVQVPVKTDQAYVQPGGEDDEDEEEDDSDHVNTDHDDVDTGFNADIWKEKRWLKVCLIPIRPL